MSAATQVRKVNANVYTLESDDLMEIRVSDWDRCRSMLSRLSRDPAYWLFAASALVGLAVATVPLLITHYVQGEQSPLPVTWIVVIWATLVGSAVLAIVCVVADKSRKDHEASSMSDLDELMDAMAPASYWE